MDTVTIPPTQSPPRPRAIVDTAMHLERQDGLGESLHEDDSSAEAIVMLIPPDTTCSTCDGPLQLYEEETLAQGHAGWGDRVRVRRRELAAPQAIGAVCKYYKTGKQRNVVWADSVIQRRVAPWSLG